MKSIEKKLDYILHGEAVRQWRTRKSFAEGAESLAASCLLNLVGDFTLVELQPRQILFHHQSRSKGEVELPDKEEAEQSLYSVNNLSTACDCLGKQTPRKLSWSCAIGFRSPVAFHKGML